MDLNADLGELEGAEGAAIDAALIATVTSANVACGGHAGDALSMRRVCVLAAEHGVAVGAQVSYVDRAGFGRRRLDVAAETLVAQLSQQLQALREAAEESGTTVSYVKPHGALYHAAAGDPDVAGAVLDAMERTVGGVPVLTLPASHLAAAARARGLIAVAEAFADRAYTPAGGLVPRDHPDAVVHDPAEVVRRVVRLAASGTVVALDGSPVAVAAQSICVHGDTPGAVRLAAEVRSALEGAGIALRAFAGAPRRRARTGRTVRAMGDRALLVRCDEGEVTALLAAVDAATGDGRLHGVEDVVPAARSLLVRLHPRHGDPVRARRLLAALAPADVASRGGTTVELEVDYDGADLDAVADEVGISREGVVARHAAGSYTVAFCGFAPGFAYLSGLDPRLRVPRLATPRTRVPAGSVAIAAAYTAVYPTSSPGGWRLIGRTTATLFDPHRDPPALLSPGDRVRFVAGAGRR